MLQSNGVAYFLKKKLMLQYGRHRRPDDKCQDLLPLKAAESRLSIPIFLLASPQKGFPFQSLPQCIHQINPLVEKFYFE